MRRPVAWLVAVVLLVEGVFIAALNWFLGVVVDRQDMSLAGLDPDAMSLSSKIGGVVFGAYFLLCALVALLVAIRDRAPAGFGRVLLISAAVVHGLLGAFAVGLVSWTAFLCMIVVLGLIVLLLMTYDAQERPAAAAAGPTGPTEPTGPTGPTGSRGPAGPTGPEDDPGPSGGPGGPLDDPAPSDAPAPSGGPAPVSPPPAPTAP